ncbi:hypothetical protein ACQP0C_31200 [Nocardia sp. CA-129566]|uniref:hypothetical protein n=1 Tax=Nocardia sp. CA-129566 TaxID=3239976 RepID=UPI003D961992
MSTDSTWPASDEENAAIAMLEQLLQGMAGLLHSVEDARYIDPSGGYVPYRGVTPS